MGWIFFFSNFLENVPKSQMMLHVLAGAAVPNLPPASSECPCDDRVHEDGFEGGAFSSRTAECDAPRPHRFLVQTDHHPHDVQYRNQGEHSERLRLVLQVLLCQDWNGPKIDLIWKLHFHWVTVTISLTLVWRQNSKSKSYTGTWQFWPSARERDINYKLRDAQMTGF